MKIILQMVRQAFDKILKKLQASEEPIIIEKDRKLAAALIPIEVFSKRHVDLRKSFMKQQILDEFRNNAMEVKEDSLKTLRDTRYA